MTAPPLYLLRLDPDLALVARWAAAERLGPNGDLEAMDEPGADGGYAWHALLGAAFGKDHAPKPFRLIDRDADKDRESLRRCSRRPPYLLAYAAVGEAELRGYAALCQDPLAAAALGLDGLKVRRMPGAFAPGLKLDFEVRVSPTVRQDKNGDRRKSIERDAFLAALDRAGPRQDRGDLTRAEVYREWLRERIEANGAAELLGFKIAALRRARLLRRDRMRRLVSIAKEHIAPGRRSVGLPGASVKENGGGPDAVFTGVLRVGDPAAFQALLARGVGRHRAFGFGMLLLKPATEG